MSATCMKRTSGLTAPELSEIYSTSNVKLYPDVLKLDRNYGNVPLTERSIEHATSIGAYIRSSDM